MNVFSAYDFALDLCLCFLSYHHCCPCYLSHQAVNIFSINKSTDCHSHSTFLFRFSQTFSNTNIPWSYNSRPHYFYNFCCYLNIADSLKTINQKLLQPEDWVLPIIPNL